MRYNSIPWFWGDLGMAKSELISAKSLLNIEGQILYLLSKSDMVAGDIYKYVSASQPTISKRLARLLDRGVICIEASTSDRRMSIYKLSDAYRQNSGLQDSREFLEALVER